MANDINRVLIVGRLTRDPELRHTGGGMAYVRISIANNKSYTSNGEKKEEVSFFNCTAWSKLAEIINQYCKKGSQVAIDGRLKQNSWQNQEGKTQSSVDIVIDQLQMLGPKPSGDSGGREPAHGLYDEGDQGYDRPPSLPDDDSDIPF